MALTTWICHFPLPCSLSSYLCKFGPSWMAIHFDIWMVTSAIHSINARSTLSLLSLVTPPTTTWFSFLVLMPQHWVFDFLWRHGPQYSTIIFEWIPVISCIHFIYVCFSKIQNTFIVNKIGEQSIWRHKYWRRIRAHIFKDNLIHVIPDVPNNNNNLLICHGKE